MGQIVKRKKKGRPSKADLALRTAPTSGPSSPPENNVRRRSLRRRNVRYTFDFDDFIDDEDDFDVDDDENETRREKELKHLLLKSKGPESEPSRLRRVDHAPPSSEEEDDCRILSKKRKINGDFQVDRGEEDDEGEEEHENDDINPDENEIDDDDDGVRFDLS